MGLRLRQAEGGEIEVEQRSGDEFFEARAGDHLMCPFQCDTCHFRNIQGREPVDSQAEDGVLLAAIRRASLDAFWARSPGTVKSNLTEMRMHLRISRQELGVAVPFRELCQRGPLPVRDDWGMLAACSMLRRSLRRGRNSTTVQFATIRRTRTAVTNYCQMTIGAIGASTVAGDKFRQRFLDVPTTSLFFERFVQGCHARMGDVVIRDQALTFDVLEALLQLLDADYSDAEAGGGSRFEVALLGAALTLGYSTALRGEEFAFCLLGPTAFESVTSEGHPRRPHVMVVLKGRFKGSKVEQEHRFPIVLTSESSVLRNQTWLWRLFEQYRVEGMGAPEGPLFRADPRAAEPVRISQLDVLFHRYLATLQDKALELIHGRVNVEEEYSFRRSIRRGSTTHARNRGVASDVVEANNRWRKVSAAGNRAPGLSMLETYTDAQAALDLCIRYSESL